MIERTAMMPSSGVIEVNCDGFWPTESDDVTSSFCAEAHLRAAVEKGGSRVIGTGANRESIGLHDPDEAGSHVRHHDGNRQSSS